ncbi:hypothetical protein Acid345_0234 [Candidatus Koribacter versatilis Ellin345]|uniref:DUF3828 domain-containing protein n=1 Tax=Koribacter versatilis (strain Ellin345) TaxID=204669 RepID=Q1IV61_KORVE|nr:hypothetical protein [Candidatus Koribacter versatilis]ABF39239.1 hypothetical protein Acid345_0234 [Candidatus Koribacter versatilis Ellin345]
MTKLVIICRWLSLFQVAALLCALSFAQQPSVRKNTPSGQSTPEGVAADYARAFIADDVSLMQQVLIRPYMGGATHDEYLRWKEGLLEHLRQEKASSAPDPQNPVKIVRVFTSRHLSKNGPASTGYALSGFQDVMFVDVEVLLHSGEKHTERTLVIKDQDGKWYVHPRPDLAPLLSAGLEEESPSQK